MTSSKTKGFDWSVVSVADGILAACISDLHLGHTRNDTARMIRAIEKNLITSGLIRRIKILFISGDVYDRLLDLSDPNATRIDRWMDRLFKVCSTLGVKVRVLKGTPSHDHDQSARFAFVHEVTHSTCDFKYFDDIEIETIEDLGLTVLYVPDEIRPTTQETQAAVKAKMEALALTHVDMACMHGFFKHQLPYAVESHSYHDADFYKSIVRDWIVIGHVHTHSREDNIVAPSSHDRLRQGEDNPKGLIAFTLKAKEKQLWFSENHDAHTHTTIDCTGMDVDQVFTAVEAVLKDQKYKAFIRIDAETNHPIFQHMLALEQAWPLHSFDKTMAKKGKKGLEQEILDDEAQKWTSVRIDRTNIVDLLKNRLTAKYDPQTVNACIHQLEECL